MSKKATTLTVILEPEMHRELEAAASFAERPASDLVHDLIREFIERERISNAYGNFLEHKVALARRSLNAGNGRSNDEIEASFLALRNAQT